MSAVATGGRGRETVEIRERPGINGRDGRARARVDGTLASGGGGARKGGGGKIQFKRKLYFRRHRSLSLSPARLENIIIIIFGARANVPKGKRNRPRTWNTYAIITPSSPSHRSLTGHRRTRTIAERPTGSALLYSRRTSFACSMFAVRHCRLVKGSAGIRAGSKNSLGLFPRRRRIPRVYRINLSRTTHPHTRATVPSQGW